jgi:hypothetical protein
LNGFGADQKTFTVTPGLQAAMKYLPADTAARRTNAKAAVQRRA